MMPAPTNEMAIGMKMSDLGIDSRRMRSRSSASTRPTTGREERRDDDPDRGVAQEHPVVGSEDPLVVREPDHLLAVGPWKLP
jgi:hypothetical protein